MHHKKAYYAALALVMATTICSSAALAQDTQNIVGSWEGYSSRGNFVIINITAQADSTYSAEVTVLEGGLGGTPTTEVYGVTQTNTDALHSQLDVSGELGTLDAYWYNADALRLVIDDDLLLILARVVTPGSSAVTAVPPQAPTP
jgi:hypothetical protein